MGTIIWRSMDATYKRALSPDRVDWIVNMALIENVVGVWANLADNSSMLLFCAAVFLLTALVCRHLVSRSKYTWPPGPRGWHLMSTSSLINPDSGYTNANMTRLGKKYHPDMFTLTLAMGKRMLILNSFKSIKEALVKQSALFSNRPIMMPFVYANENRRLVGIFSEPYSDAWKREKKYMMSTLRHFGYGTSGSEDNILREADNLVRIIQKKGGQPFDLATPVGRCMLNVTFSIVFNTTYEEDDKEIANLLAILAEWIVETYKLHDVEAFLPFLDRFGLSARLRRAKKMTKTVCAFIQKHIDHHKATLDPNNPRDMVDECLIEMAKADPNSDLREFDDEKLVWSIMQFIPDQGDTATGVFSFLILATILHSEVERRVLQEIQEVIGDRPPTLHDKEKMPYTEAVILETLRMDTAFSFLIAHSTAEDAEIFGYKIPKDTTVVPNFFAVHFDPELWGDPETFRPERFIDEHGRVVRPEYFIPYSTGRRTCIGEQLSQKEFFLFYVTLMQKYKFKLPDGDPIPKLEAQWFWVAPPDYRLQAEPRN